MQDKLKTSTEFLGRGIGELDEKITSGFDDLTVVIPNYNNQKFLHQLLEQIAPTDMEIIVIDGASTDGSVDVIKRFSDRITYWVSEPDSGQADAIRKGLSKVKTKYVSYQNSDDLFFLRGVLEACDLLKKTNADLVFGPVLRIDSDGVIFDWQKYSKMTRISSCFTIPFNNQSLIIRSDIANNVGINPSLHFCFDLEFAIRLLKVAARVELTRLPIGALRFHSDTKTSSLQGVQASERKLVQQAIGRPCLPQKSVLFRAFRFFEVLVSGDFEYLLRSRHSEWKSAAQVDGRRGP